MKQKRHSIHTAMNYYIREQFGTWKTNKWEKRNVMKGEWNYKHSKSLNHPTNMLLCSNPKYNTWHWWKSQFIYIDIFRRKWQWKPAKFLQWLFERVSWLYNEQLSTHSHRKLKRLMWLSWQNWYFSMKWFPIVLLLAFTHAIITPFLAYIYDRFIWESSENYI